MLQKCCSGGVVGMQACVRARPCVWICMHMYVHAWAQHGRTTACAVVEWQQARTGVGGHAVQACHDRKERPAGSCAQTRLRGLQGLQIPGCKGCKLSVQQAHRPRCALRGAAPTGCMRYAHDPAAGVLSSTQRLQAPWDAEGLCGPRGRHVFGTQHALNVALLS